MKNVSIIFILSVVFLFTSCEKIENFTEIGTPRFSGSYAPVLINSPDEIDIVSFNIEFAEKIEEAILELETSENLRDADIIMLQEMDEVGTEAIAQALSYNCLLYTSPSPRDRG